MTLANSLTNAVVGGLALISLGNPVMAQSFSGTSSGTFGNPNPGANSNPVFTGVGTNTFTWGDPSNSGTGPNLLNFEGNPFSTSVNTLFQVGDLTYFNGTVASESLVDAVPLNVILDFTVPNSAQKTFSFDFKLNSTPNTGTPEQNADFVFPINAIASQSFEVNGTNYTLELTGFSQDGGATTVNEFRVLESATTTAALFGRITPISDPKPNKVSEPSSVLGFLAISILGGSSWLKRRQQQKG